MARHIIRRLIQSIPTFFGITLLSYMIMAAAPGGPAKLITFQTSTPESQNSDATRREIERLGLNDPWPVQYLAWLAGNDWMWWKGPVEERDPRAVRYGILRGDFGNSFFKKRPTMDMIGERLPASFELGVSSLIVALVLGVPLGILSAIWRGSPFDNGTRVMAVVGNAIPNFWFGLILLLIFGSWLGWLPMGDRCDPLKYSRTPCPPVHQRLEHLILPTIVLAYGGVAGYSRYMRTAMLDTINSDYVRTARAKGLPPRAVWFRHAARNALIPLATFLGPALVGVIGGAAITESIFTWPGLGRLFLESISARDYPVIMASVVIGSILTVIAYIISDILYAVFDPRIRF